jgi:polyhydroxyalkanoate synthase
MQARRLIPTVSDLVLGRLDQARRRTGQVLDAVGAGPRPTPSTILLDARGFRLHRFGEPAGGAPAVLLVPAPIKRWYIWDLAPDVSVVRRCLEHGLRVYLVEWTPATREESGFGLDDYAGGMLTDCIAAVADDSGQPRVRLVGHSLGGTLAAICAARRPDLVAALILLEAPLTFGAKAGAFAPVVALAPHAAWLATPQRPVPGSLLNLVTGVAAPVTFHVARYADLALSLPNPTALRTHVRVQRWTLDEFPLPGRLFEEVVERLYRRDELMAGTLSIGGRRVGPASLTAPTLSVINPLSRVIPPESIVPFHEAAASRTKRLLRYYGDVGVAV